MAATVPEQSQFLGAAMAGTDQVGAGEAEAGLLAWSRLPGQACKIPTQLVTTLESGSRSALSSLATWLVIQLLLQGRVGSRLLLRWQETCCGLG